MNATQNTHKNKSPLEFYNVEDILLLDKIKQLFFIAWFVEYARLHKGRLIIRIIYPPTQPAQLVLFVRVIKNW